MTAKARLIAALLLCLTGAACGDDDDTMTDTGGPDSGSDAMIDAAPDTSAGDTAMDAPAEDVAFQVRLENTATAFAFPESGVIEIPDGAEERAPIGPDGAYTITFNAGPGMNLSFATMFVPSNDFFFAPDGGGIALFDEDGSSLAEDAALDVTDQIQLWDAGTEIDQPIGEGADQVQRQGDPDTGADDPTDRVRLVPAEAGAPAVDQVMRAELSSEIVDGVHEFTLTITNVSTMGTIATDPTQAVPLSPGVFVLHGEPNPLFTEGEADRGEGLEGIAEDGSPDDLVASLATATGITIVSSPGAYVVTDAAGAFFMGGEVDRGEGLEAIAEDGMPMTLASAIAGATAVNTPVDADGPGPLTPGAAYEFTVRARPGDRLHLATMFVPSNDWIFTAGGGMGLPLFDEDGQPITGDQSSALTVWDVGTEVDQRPGFGLDQVQFQSGLDTGEADEDTSLRQVLPDEVSVDLGAMTLTVTPI